MASINDFGGGSPDTLASPPLGGPSGWAAAVAAALNGSDTTVDARVAAAIAAHLAASDPHPTYSTAAELAAAVAAHVAAADPHSMYLTPAEHAAIDHTGLPGVGAGGGGSTVAYQPEAPVSPTDGMVWVDSDSEVVPGTGGGSGGGGALVAVYSGTATAAGSFTLPDGTLGGHRRHRILARISNASEDLQLCARLRVGGVDDSTDLHYDTVRLFHYGGTGAVDSNVLGQTFWGSILHCDETNPGMMTVELDGASIAEKTLFESFGVGHYYTTGNLQIRNSGRHTEETAYDSLTFLADVGTCDWIVDVFAYDETATGGGSSGGGGATGGGTDQVFYENDIHVTTDYEITAGKNAMSAGPITVDSGAEVTVPSGSVWTVV